MFLDTLVQAKHQFVTQIRENVGLFRLLRRRSTVVRYWLLSAHRAQMTIFALFILIPFVITPLIDILLTMIFSPVTERVLFGLIRNETRNPYLDAAETITRFLIWTSGCVVGAYFYLLHIPKTLEYARKVAEEKISRADGLLVKKPSESIVLYNAACAWSVDEATDKTLVAKLEYINDVLQRKNGNTIVMTTKTVVCDHSFEVPDQALIGDRYRIKEQLGSGAMGIVYIAEDKRLQRDVALKQLSPQFSTDEKARARFRQEALALARLSHPNIVQVYDFVEEKRFFWIAMELITGENLGEKLQESGHFTIDEALRLAEQMAEALGYAHERGVVHRDFKPANVLLTAGGDIKITDFGIAKIAHSSIHTQMHTIMGSPAYMSPEQAGGSYTDERTDVYALGIVIYQMISGEVPFQGDAKSVIAQHLTKAPPLLSEKLTNTPPQLENMLQKMLTKEPDERFQSMAEVLGQLKQPTC